MFQNLTPRNLKSLVTSRLIFVFSFHSGLHIMCYGNTLCGLCDDMLRCCERNLLVTLRNTDEVHRTDSINESRICSARLPDVGTDYMATKSEVTSYILHHIRFMGRRRRGLADPSKR